MALRGFVVVWLMLMFAAGTSYTIIKDLNGNEHFIKRVMYSIEYEWLVTFGEFGYDCNKYIEVDRFER